MIATSFFILEKLFFFMEKDFSQVGTLLESIQKHLANGTVYHKGHLNSLQGILARFRGTNLVPVFSILLEHFMSPSYHFSLDAFPNPPVQFKSKQPPPFLLPSPSFAEGSHSKSFFPVD